MRHSRSARLSSMQTLHPLRPLHRVHQQRIITLPHRPTSLTEPARSSHQIVLPTEPTDCPPIPISPPFTILGRINLTNPHSSPGLITSLAAVAAAGGTDLAGEAFGLNVERRLVVLVVAVLVLLTSALRLVVVDGAKAAVVCGGRSWREEGTSLADMMQD